MNDFFVKIGKEKIKTEILGSATIYDKILLCQELKELMLVDMYIMF